MRVLSLVRFREGVDRDTAWRAWAEHTRDWDSRDHPKIRRTVLTLTARSLVSNSSESVRWPNLAKC